MSPGLQGDCHPKRPRQPPREPCCGVGGRWHGPRSLARFSRAGLLSPRACLSSVRLPPGAAPGEPGAPQSAPACPGRTQEAGLSQGPQTTLVAPRAVGLAGRVDGGALLAADEPVKPGGQGSVVQNEGRLRLHEPRRGQLLQLGPGLAVVRLFGALRPARLPQAALHRGPHPGGAGALAHAPLYLRPSFACVPAPSARAQEPYCHLWLVSLLTPGGHLVTLAAGGLGVDGEGTPDFLARFPQPPVSAQARLLGQLPPAAPWV